MHEISRSGLIAASTRLDVSAHNTANATTDQFKAQRVVQQERKDGGTQTQIDTVELSSSHGANKPDLSPLQNNVDLAQENVERIQAKHAFSQNARAIRIKDQMDQSLLDTLG